MNLLSAVMVAVIAVTGINTVKAWGNGITLRGLAVRLVIIVWAVGFLGLSL